MRTSRGSYTAATSARPGRPSRVGTTRRGRTISVTWRPVRTSVRYEVLVDLADQSKAYRVVRTTHASLPDPFPGMRGAVRIDVLAADGSRGSAASVNLTAQQRRR